MIFWEPLEEKMNRENTEQAFQWKLIEAQTQLMTKCNASCGCIQID